MTETEKVAFDSLNLPEKLQEGIKKAGFEYCTPIQAQTLPRALAGQLGDDVLTERLGEAFALYRERASSGQVAADFPAQYLATLEAAAATISATAVRDSLARIISEAAS